MGARLFRNRTCSSLITFKLVTCEWNQLWIVVCLPIGARVCGFKIKVHVIAYHSILHSCLLFGISAFLSDPNKYSTAAAVQNKTILQDNFLFAFMLPFIFLTVCPLLEKRRWYTLRNRVNCSEGKEKTKIVKNDKEICSKPQLILDKSRHTGLASSRLRYFTKTNRLLG